MINSSVISEDSQMYRVRTS